MKTLLFKTLAVVFAIMGSYSLKSQVACPYMINNHLNCNVVLSIQFYDGNFPACPPCGPPVNVTVPANTMNFLVPCTCIPACDVAITVVGIAGPCGAPYMSGTGSLGTPFVPLPGLPPCCGASPGAHFNVSPSLCIIVP